MSINTAFLCLGGAVMCFSHSEHFKPMPVPRNFDVSQKTPKQKKGTLKKLK